MDYITDYITDIPNNISYKIYDELFYKTHIYIVNNLYTNHEIYNYDEDELTSLQYFNIMSFLDEINE